MHPIIDQGGGELVSKPAGDSINLSDYRSRFDPHVLLVEIDLSFSTIRMAENTRADRIKIPDGAAYGLFQVHL
jgi:hypothetical protein